MSPIQSLWSTVRSFTTVLSGSVTAPDLSSPGSGVTVSVTPVFEWGQLAGAEKYELVIATDAAFDNQVVQKTGSNALPATAWQCDITLQPDTAYYWKVRAVSSQSFSAWSRVNVFITRSAPVITTSVEVSTVPAVTKTLTETKTEKETLTVISTTVSTQPVVRPRQFNRS